ncbi:MAG: sodium:proton antiporter [Mediterranea massiliensis]|nr:sodium:proton antiporter [Mediterranea massiliensis]
MEIPFWILMPFVAMLLCIAIAPLVAEEKWEKNRNKFCVSMLLGSVVAIWMVVNNNAENEFTHKLIHQMVYDYVPFILLLTALFVVTGGIHVKGDIQATPKVNTIILAIGFVLASLMGTTGAAMLLIRPLLSTNSQRKYTTHTVLFFIALVANTGGLLTPLGDPPLFLLYLRGAEFTWFLSLIPVWAFVGISLLLIYYLLDTYYYTKREAVEHLMHDAREQTPIRITGNINFLWLLCVVASVMFINGSYIPAMADEHAPFYIKLLREIVLIAIIFLSLFTTKKEIRQDNHYSWSPIIEVAVLFVGIFATMTPALIYLNANAGNLGLTEPWQFYYCTGLLSSFLDNAPTAVAFHSVASGLPVVEGVSMVAGIQEILLKSIATASVFFGAMTYIGNGPNFMVKAIAEQSGLKMPSFFGYIFGFSLIVLLPLYVIAQIIFF